MSEIKIFYGIPDNVVDVTEIAIQNFLVDNTLRIPINDNYRASVFGDPIYGVLKSIFIGEITYPYDTEVVIENFIPVVAPVAPKTK